MGNNSSKSPTTSNAPRQEGEASANSSGQADPTSSSNDAEVSEERRKRSSRRAKRRIDTSTPNTTTSISSGNQPEAKRQRTSSPEDSAVFAAARTIGKHVWEEAVTVCVPEDEATKLPGISTSDEIGAKAGEKAAKEGEKTAETWGKDGNPTASATAPKPEDDKEGPAMPNSPPPPTTTSSTPPTPIPAPRASRTTKKRAAKPSPRTSQKRHPMPPEEQGFKCPFCGVKGVVPVQGHASSCAIRLLKAVPQKTDDEASEEEEEEDDRTLQSSPSRSRQSRSMASPDQTQSSVDESRTATASRASTRKKDKDSRTHGDEDDSSTDDSSTDGSSSTGSSSTSSGSSSTSDSSDTLSSDSSDSDTSSTVDSDATTTSLDTSDASSSSEDEETLETISTTTTSPSVQENQLQYASLSRWLKELMNEDEDVNQYQHDDDESILEYIEESGAPKPVAILAYYLHHHCPKVTDVLGIDNNHNNNQTSHDSDRLSERWKWFREHFPHRTGAFMCPRPPIPTSSKARRQKHRLLGMSPDYAVVAGCTIWLLEWELLLQSAPPETASLQQQQPRYLQCTRCTEGHLVYDHLERLIPVFGDCGTKPSWIVSNQYKCSSCDCTISGSGSELLASLPKALRRSYPSLISWVSPNSRFQVTRSLGRRIYRTLKGRRPNGARKLEFFLLTQYDALYAAEEMEFRARAKGGTTINNNNSNKAEEFPPFREWLGEVDLPRASEIEDLYRYATSATG